MTFIFPFPPKSRKLNLFAFLRYQGQISIVHVRACAPVECTFDINFDINFETTIDINKKLIYSIFIA